MSQKNYEIQVFDNKEQLEGKVWSKTSKWMFNRLQLGRKNADYLIAQQKELIISQLPEKDQLLLQDNPESMEAKILFKTINKQAVNRVFTVAFEKDLRQLQYIMKADKIVNVATVKHVLFPIKEVKETAIKVFQNNGYKLSNLWDKYGGVLGTNKQIKSPFGDLRVGLGLSFGNINLTRAIKFGAYFEICVCTNPLTFLELSNTMGTQIAMNQTRILRIGNPENLLKKVEVGLNDTLQSWDGSAGIMPQMKKNGKTYLSITNATYITKAMGTAYQIGNAMQDEIISSFRNSTKNVWSLSMIMTQIARDSDNFRKNAVKTPAKLSAMGLVLLTTKKVPQVIRNSKKYCETHNITI